MVYFLACGIIPTGLPLTGLPEAGKRGHWSMHRCRIWGSRTPVDMAFGGRGRVKAVQIEPSLAPLQPCPGSVLPPIPYPVLMPAPSPIWPPEPLPAQLPVHSPMLPTAVGLDPMLLPGPFQPLIIYKSGNLCCQLFTHLHCHSMPNPCCCPLPGLHSFTSVAGSTVWSRRSPAVCIQPKALVKSETPDLEEIIWK